MKNNGFTLIELMIIVAIIGILASIALPAYQDYVARSQVTESIILASSLKPAVVDVWNQFGTLSVANSGVNGIPSASSVTGKYVSQVSVMSGIITATLNGDNISPSIAGTTLILTPDTTSSTGFSWICTGSMPPKVKPKACQ